MAAIQIDTKSHLTVAILAPLRHGAGSSEALTWTRSDPSLPFRLADRNGRHARAPKSATCSLLLDRPEVISFAGGIPDPDLFPVEAVAAAADSVASADRRPVAAIRSDPGRCRRCGAGSPSACAPGAWDGCTPENVLVTAGSQQALDLIARLLVGARRHGGGGGSQLSRRAAGVPHLAGGLPVADR